MQHLRFEIQATKYLRPRAPNRNQLAGTIGARRLGMAKTDIELKREIEAALQRQGNTDANTIQVDSVGGAVTLSGKARTRHAIEAATAAAWSAAGVTSVVDRVAMNAS